MCLGEIAEVLQVGPGPRALVRSGHRPATVSLLTLEEPVAAGDWVVCHSGFALSRVSATEAAEAAAIRTAVTTPTTKATTTEDEQ
jgi:hydrogenase expression/formation protein HypC